MIETIVPRRRLTLNDAELLTAGWMALAVILIAARCWILHLAGKAQPGGAVLTPWLPLAIYQDLSLVVALALLADLLLRRVSQPRGRLLLR